MGGFAPDSLPDSTAFDTVAVGWGEASITVWLTLDRASGGLGHGRAPGPACRLASRGGVPAIGPPTLDLVAQPIEQFVELIVGHSSLGCKVYAERGGQKHRGQPGPRTGRHLAQYRGSFQGDLDRGTEAAEVLLGGLWCVAGHHCVHEHAARWHCWIGKGQAVAVGEGNEVLKALGSLFEWFEQQRVDIVQVGLDCSPIEALLPVEAVVES